jgi:hypothetical protein
VSGEVEKKSTYVQKADGDILVGVGIYSISKSIVSLLPSSCRATALSATRRLDTIDLEMELQVSSGFITMRGSRAS